MKRLKYSKIRSVVSTQSGSWAATRLLALLLLSSLGIAHAGALLELYQQARDDDPTFRAAMRQAEAVVETVEQARALWRPSVSVTASAGANQQDVRQSPGQSLYKTGQVDYDAKEYSLTVSQALFNAGHSATGEQAAARLLQAQAEFRSQQQDLILRVAERYFGAVALYEGYRSLESELDSLSRHLAEVSRRREVGLVRRTDLLEAQARLSEAEARRLEAHIRYADALRGLAELTGRQPERLGTLGQRQLPSLPEPTDPAYWAEQAVRNNPLIDARRQAMVVAAIEVRRQGSAQYPTLDLAWRTGRNYASDSLYGGPSDVANNELRLSLNVPIYSGGMVSSREREAAKQVERAAEELRAQERSVERNVLGSHDRIRGANARIEALLQSQRLIEQGLAVKRTSYANGLATSLAVIDAERDLDKVRSELARARYDFMLGWLSLRRAAGLLAESDLQALDALLEREVALERPGS